MVRAPFFDKNGVKKGAWSPEEDEKLKSYIQNFGHWNWRELPKFAGLSRCGKSCRLRWMNYLRPEVKHGRFTEEENDLILKLHQQHGNRWSLIASKLPARTDNEIKNHWNTTLKKRAAELKKVQMLYSSKSCESDSTQISKSGTQSAVVSDDVTLTPVILESTPLSPLKSSRMSDISGSLNSDHESMIGASSSPEIYEASSGDFWTQPFVSDNMFNNFGYSLETRFEVPYDDLFYDESNVELFYQLMQELPES